MPERFASFTLIVLGESVLAVVVGLDSAAGGSRVTATAIAGFVIACGIWWVYFDRFDGEFITRALEEQTGTANLWTFVYGYGHLLLYASVLASGIALRVILSTGDTIPLFGIAIAGVLLGLLVIWARVRRPPAQVVVGVLGLAIGSVVVSAGWLDVVATMVVLAVGWVALALLVSASDWDRVRAPDPHA
jgi:low temperature requirement protein LtrA